MNTENENWRDSSEEKDAGREGNKNYERGDHNRWDDNNRSYNRENSYNREGGYERRSYGDRPQRQSYNKPGNYDRGYHSDRPQRSYNRDENRSYNRDENRSYNRDENRPYRPRFNPNGGGDQQQRRPRISREEGGQRNYGGERRPYNQGQDRPNWRNNNEGGERPRFNRNSGGQGGYNSYNNDRNRGGDDRYQRPRYSNNNRQQGGYSRPYRTDDYDPNAKYSVKKRIEYKEQFVDPNEPIRLNKYLANAGVCSRREADEFITAGAVSVNDVVVTELGTKIKRTDVVKFHNELVSIERKVYILLNKPKDCVTTSDDPQDRKTVLDFVKGACEERIYPVGRLDRNTTGVLLLTNDGDLASKLTHPKFLKKKIYHVVTDKNVTRADLETLAGGVKLDDEDIQIDAVSYTDEVKRNSIGIEIHSGQNRVVRRIFEAVGYRVLRLDRVYFAGLTKKGLRRGDWRYLTENEVNFLRMGSFN